MTKLMTMTLSSAGFKTGGEAEPGHISNSLFVITNSITICLYLVNCLINLSSLLLNSDSTFYY